jgi:hypothetical protein
MSTLSESGGIGAEVSVRLPMDLMFRVARADVYQLPILPNNRNERTCKKRTGGGRQGLGMAPIEGDGARQRFVPDHGWVCERVANSVNEACGDFAVRDAIDASPCDAPLGSPTRTASTPRTLLSESLRVRVSYL